MSGLLNNTQDSSSRLLAALDCQTFNSATPSPSSNSGAKRKGVPDNAHTSGSDLKRRAVQGGRSPVVIRHEFSGKSAGRPRETSDLQAPMRRLSVSPRKPKSILPVGTGDFNLNYDDSSQVRRIDKGGPDQQQKLMEFVANAIDNFSDKLTVKEAMCKLGLRHKKDLLPGLEIRLLAHQVIGVAWMLDQERYSPHRGGILADEMGLGKTVQMLATMAMNLPDLDDRRRTTLIIVPSALLQQWKDEIESKTNDVFNVHIHHGRSKLKTVEDLEAKDVIITTYQTLNLDFSVPEDTESGEEAAWLAEHGGVLARMKWYRAVIDEAQFIRNRSTISSRAVAMIHAKYRWMLTGTPVTNSLADIYGLLRFGRFRPWNDWDDFNVYIAKEQINDAPLAAERAKEVLRPLMLRRNKNSTLEGEPIIKLPPKDIELKKLEFSVEERELYDSFERKSKLRIGRFIKARTLLKNHAAVLVMILRLRQLCCHPNLILSLAEGYEDPTLLVGSDADKELGRALKIMGAPWVAEVKKRFLARARATEYLDFSDEMDEPEATCPVCHDLYMNDSGRVLACGHEICFDCVLNLSNSEPVHDGQFGYGSEKENLRAEKEYETAVAKGLRACPTCKKMMNLTPSKMFKSSAFEPSEEELKENSRTKRRRAKASQDCSGDEMRSPSPSPSPKKIVYLADSDDELPDVSQILAEPSIRHVGRGSSGQYDEDESSDEETNVQSPSQKNHERTRRHDGNVIDLTFDKISVGITSATPSRTPSKLKAERTNDDSDIEIIESPAKTSPAKVVSPPKQSFWAPRPSMQRSEARRKGKVKDNGNQGPSDAIIATWRKGDEDLEPSTKMLALIDLLEEWHATGDKTICYSQWTSMLDLIEILFSRHGIRSLRYDGKMNREERDCALATFKKPGGPKVILISTKCGGVGLNLVSANRVINMDLSWNFASESQAYDRVHRLGQDKDVFIKRLVVRNTIEERMLQLQDVKVGLAEAALGEGTAGQLHKLSMKDIKFLFGMTKKKENTPQPPT